MRWPWNDLCGAAAPRRIRWRLGALGTVLVLGTLLGCARPPQPARVDVGRVAVFPPCNETGDPLVVSGETLIEKYVFRTEPYTVPEALAALARAQLAASGFAVVAPAEVDAAVGTHPPQSATEAAAAAARAGIEGAVLYTEIRRWEPDGQYEPRFVIVSASVRLVDVATGREVWGATHASRPIKTPGVVNTGQAYGIAAQKLMADLLGPLRPAHPAGASQEP